jgi:hypothetical protein
MDSKSSFRQSEIIYKSKTMEQQVISKYNKRFGYLRNFGNRWTNKIGSLYYYSQSITLPHLLQSPAAFESGYRRIIETS